MNLSKFTVDYLFNRACVGTELVFLLWPQRCHVSNKLLFLQYAYKKTAMWTGAGDPVFEYRYYHKKEFILARLKDIV